MKHNVEFYIEERIKCEKNALYFIQNYIIIPQIGHDSNKKMIGVNFHDKMRRVIRCLFRFHRVLLMASRQLGKSTIAAAILTWVINFFPRMPVIILNMKQDAALENINKIKYMHDKLPIWLKTPRKSNAERKTYFELKNDSVVKIFYPSTVTPPDQLGRSLTSSVLYIDEAAFIRHISDAYASAQPILSTATEQAKENNVPYFTLMTSTPNGVHGDGSFFYSMWNNAIDSDDLFNDDGSLIDNYEEVYKSESKNNFVRIKYHWSDDSRKTEDWYVNQKKELNFDTRRVNQELDLVFLGSSTSIFDDEVLQMLKEKKPIKKLRCPYGTQLKFFDELQVSKYYIIGIDTAKSLIGDYSAIQIYSYEDFSQVGELFARIGSINKYAEVIKFILNYITEKVGNKIILAVENNSIGGALLEVIEKDYPEYIDYVYNIDFKKYSYGISTNVKTKGLMVSLFYDFILETPSRIKSADLIAQLSIIERHSNGSISAKKGMHDDLFMASAFCAYVKKLSALEYDSKSIGIDSDIFKYVASTPGPKQLEIFKNSKAMKETINEHYNDELLNYINYYDKKSQSLIGTDKQDER